MEHFPATAAQLPQKVDSQVANVKTPPHSLEAEQAVLGGLMLENTAWDRIVDRLSDTDFYRPAHQLIFRVMAHLIERNTPFDVLTLSEALRTRNELEQAGGELYLFELARNTPTVANIVAYADIVRERAVLRQLIQIASEIAADAFNPADKLPNQLLETAETKIFKIAERHSRGSGPVRLSNLLADAIDLIRARDENPDGITGVASGFTDLDEKTAGLQPGDLIIVAGRPSMGKTAFAMNVAENVAIKGQKSVLVFSMEMSGESLAMRLLSSLSHVNQQKIRTGQKLADEDWSRIMSSVGFLDQAQLFIDDTPALSPAELRARARRLAREQKSLGLIVVDYLQLMQVPGNRENRATEISEISRSLKALAKELNVPVIALSQLNRSLEQRQEKRPIMSDLRESGSIEQDADLIMFIYRDEVYNEESPDKGTAEIIIGKQRNGPIGMVRLTFRGEYTRFDNYTATNALNDPWSS